MLRLGLLLVALVAGGIAAWLVIAVAAWASRRIH